MTLRPLSVNYDDAMGSINYHELEYFAGEVEYAHDLLHEKKGPGNEETGWLVLPTCYQTNEFEEIKTKAEEIRDKADAMIVIGVGGSYLGARSGIQFVNHLEDTEDNSPEIYFAGYNISGTQLSYLLDKLTQKEVYVNVISKSGTTLEPSIAFRVIRDFMEKKYGKTGAEKRIIATTDKEKGELKELATERGYYTFTIPRDIGGRYSVLTPVGLFPMAVAGIDIEQVMEGALDAYSEYSDPYLFNNQCYQYALIRNLLYQKGKHIELLVNYEPFLTYTMEWWKQLFGESEGKDQKGIFPASVNFTTDLHSLGQYIQDGRRVLFETTIWIERPPKDLEVPRLKGGDDDGIGYLAGTQLSDINRKAFLGTKSAHTEGGVPNITISIPEASSYYYGQMVYFFMKACAVSGYLLGVNPFNQPGVEAYKQEVSSRLNSDKF